MATYPRQVVTIRSVDLGDAADVQHYASDASIAATSNVPHPYPENGGIHFVQRSLADRQSGERYPCAILVNGKFAGIMSLNAINHVEGTAELDYWVAVSFWGQGVATAAARLAVDLAFKELALRTVFSGCWVGNPASGRVLGKVGFVEIETIVNDGSYGQKFEGQPIRRFRLERVNWKRPV